MSEIDLLIEELEDIENNPIKPFVAIRIGGYLRNYKYHEYRIAELEHDLTNKEIEYTDLWDDALAFQARIAELESLVEQLIWVGNDLLVSNTNPVTITLFNGLVCNAKERER